MGLGKTIQIIACVLREKESRQPFLIVVPNSTVSRQISNLYLNVNRLINHVLRSGNRVREFARWAPDIRAVPFCVRCCQAETLHLISLSQFTRRRQEGHTRIRGKCVYIRTWRYPGDSVSSFSLIKARHWKLIATYEVVTKNTCIPIGNTVLPASPVVITVARWLTISHFRME
jgi:hypothetical protein